MGLYTMALYDAFVSYSHAKDKPIAAALQSVVQRLGKPWYRRRALRLFRDDTSLSATPHLWPTIEQALGQSRFFILLASPEAAASSVGQQGGGLLARPQERGHAADRGHRGELAWDDTAGDFAWRDSVAAAAGAQRPLLGRAEMGGPARLSRRRRQARRQVHRASRRFCGRHPRHAEGGPAFARGAPTAPCADFGLVGGVVAADPDRRCGLAMEHGGRPDAHCAGAARSCRVGRAGRPAAARACGKSARHGHQGRKRHGVRTGAGVPRPERHAGWPDAPHSRSRQRAAKETHGIGRKHARPVARRSGGAERTAVDAAVPRSTRARRSRLPSAPSN